ncbi:MAG: TetR/AcrR family transcriptional regulator [Myxococcales bacterium]|nr:TetR/AcrR family transcriptional regulator [Myxococcales bacterium]
MAEKKGKRRAQIASAMLDLLGEEGMAAATIGAVAKRAHLAPGLVHYHFSDKAELIAVAFERLIERHQRRLARLDPLLDDPPRWLAGFIDIHLGLGDADETALRAWIVFSGEALRDDTIRRRYSEVVEDTIDRLVDVITRGVRARVMRCDPATAAAAIVALIQGYLQVAATARGAIPAGSAAVAARAMVSGLVGQPLAPTARDALAPPLPEDQHAVRDIR